jgi:choline kinase
METAMNIIVLAAGQSSRFPNMRPKYLLTAYDHKLMIEHALGTFDSTAEISVVVLREHCEQFQADSFLKEALGSRVTVVIIDKPTNGPAATALLAIEQLNITGPVFIKDCDSFFEFSNPIKNCNGIAVATLKDYPDIRNVSNKSYVKSNQHGIVQSIVEKQIVSDLFSAGGYQFKDAQVFAVTAARLLNSASHEIYLSNVIDSMIADGELFETLPACKFVDVGTAADWISFNRQHPVLFCDIDGVLITNQSHYGANKFGTPVTVLDSNVSFLLEQQANGAQFIFTTSRQSSYDAKTNQLLTELGFVNYQLLSGLNTTNRILINDFDYSNPYPSANAINIKRNTDDLERYFK